MSESLTLIEANQLARGTKNKALSDMGLDAKFKPFNDQPSEYDVSMTCNKVVEWLKDNKESHKSITVKNRIMVLENKIEELVESKNLTYELLALIGFLNATIYVLVESLEPDHPRCVYLSQQVGVLKRRYFNQVTV